MAATTVANWSFTPFPPFPATIFPNIAVWNASSNINNTTYQGQVSWPFEWKTREESNGPALTMYVLDGNAVGMTAAEGFKRRKPVSFGQQDSVVVSVGYPLTDSVYDMANRFIDYKPPFPGDTGSPSGADDFLDFIDVALRPWLRRDVFPNVEFTRDALFGHSFGGLLVVYALVSRPDMFDTYLASSPALTVQNDAILDEVATRFGTGDPTKSAYYSSFACNETSTLPALMITYGNLEQFPARRRTENETAFQERKSYFWPLGMTEHCHELFDRVKASGKVRDVVLKEYVGQDHSGVAASAIVDGIDYFVDW
ncbi:ferri-bacillibactin esterase [Corynascus novoguineensis]|uniref:Ferri-bacillibactin esterase n=1 Tax=Corynascus novoguineensis TaxID=1126955 RepID=A0AAN7CMB6_9PEZI|nr:ferri-bacillibactin esterase [Corynascus novoguineensis]